MTNIQVLNGLMTLLGCVAVVVFMYGPWQRMVADAVRQRWFEIRDDVFDVAARGEIEFSDPHYLQFRSSVNCLIRHAEGTTLWRALAVYRCLRGSGRVIQSSHATLTSEVGKPVPSQIRHAETQVLRWFALLMWLRSPFLIIATFALILLSPLILLFATASAPLRRAPFAAAATVRTIVLEEAKVQAHLRPAV
jgi:hypothetical protein